MEFTISPQETKIRLDKFLVQKFPQYSRSWIQKLIKEALVLVNREKASPHYFLKENDKIEINLKKPKPISPQAVEGKIEIIFENRDFLVINKPSSLMVYSSQKNKRDTLVNFLLARYPEIKNIGPDKLRPGIVHRLDKNTSGLMVITKTEKAFKHLKSQFENGKIKKEYLVLVYGKVKEREGKITFPIFRSKKKGYKMVIRRFQDLVDLKAKPALTEFKVIKYFSSYTFLKVQIKTGRTHQIRVHFNAIGHPLVGEKIYKPRKLKTKNLERPFLHAHILGFYDLKGQWQKFKQDLPEELKKFLKNLEKDN